MVDLGEAFVFPRCRSQVVVKVHNMVLANTDPTAHAELTAVREVSSGGGCGRCGVGWRPRNFGETSKSRLWAGSKAGVAWMDGPVRL